MVMTLPDKVWGNDEDLPQFLALYTQGNDADKDNRCTLLFLSPTQVFDPNEFGKVDPLPVDLVAWLQAHPYLTTLSQANTTVGGLPAVQLTFNVKAGLPFSDAAFGHHVKFLFPPGRGGDRVPPYGVGSGDTGNIIVVQVGGQPIVVIPDKAHPGCDFSTFGPQQQVLLTTLRFPS
jgi:hypothetical protein